MNKSLKKVLITGVSGMLGSNLAWYLRKEYLVAGTFNQHSISMEGVIAVKCDLTNPEEVEACVKEHDPDIVIHCASLTDVDDCENNPERTSEVNVKATEILAQNCIKRTFVYISTDQVYEGSKGDYSEEETDIKQKNIYGQSKYYGEQVVCRIVSNYLILRTNIFGWKYIGQSSLGEWILSRLMSGEKITGFTDVKFSSIYTMEFARILTMLLQKKITGTYNCASSNSLSKYDFAVKLAKKFGIDSPQIQPASIGGHPFTAERGKKLSLNINKLQSKLSYKIPDIAYSIDQFYRDFHTGIPEKIKPRAEEPHFQNNLIPYGQQWLNESDISSVLTTLKSNWITQGPAIPDFEASLEQYCHASYSTAVNSGTSALHIACLAAGIGPGDEAITSPITFVASANCVVYCGGTPIFSDIDEKTYNLSPEKLELKINERTKAVIPVHFAGQSCDMEQIHRIVKKAEKKFGHKIFIIEDASHALGSKYHSHQVGASTFSDMTVFSFHPVKHITTAEGGAVLTNDALLNDKLKQFRSHGIVNTSEKLMHPAEGIEQSLRFGEIPRTWYYEQVALGYNYRLTDIQAALGLSQIKRINLFRKNRRKIVKRYNKEFASLSHVQTPYEATDCESNFHLYILQFDFNALGITRAEFMLKLREKGILTQVHYIPVHTQPFFQNKFKTAWGDCPIAEKYYSRCLSIPLFPKMTEKNINKVISSVFECLKVGKA